MSLPTLTAIPPDVVALDDYIPLAKERMEADTWAYLTGGAADEVTLKANRAIYDQIQLIPRVLTDLKQSSTKTNLLGKNYAHPIFVAPTAFHKLYHPDGELATVVGASALETPMIVSTSATFSIEEIAQQSTIPPWFQLYLQSDKRSTLEIVRRAEAAGYFALVVTVDAPLNGIRNREQRAGFQIPAGIEAVNLTGIPQLPPANSVFGSAQLQVAPQWSDIEWLASETKLPILVKGIMHPFDARKAKEHGANGVIISNHGGRVLDTVPATLEVLPAIKNELQADLPILIDGGIHRGSDVFKALALGASAVLLGRPILYGLAAAGPVGVAHCLRILRMELEMTMALTGCPTIADITPDSIWESSQRFPKYT